jgi:hypothetical protein
MEKKYIHRLCQLLPALLTILFLSLTARAQNVSSPYSILGIGDVDTKDFGRYFSSGNASIARRDFYGYNFANPASLTALPLKTMHFDMAMRGRSGSYAYPDADTTLGIPSNDFVVKRVSMAFRISPKTGIAFGLKPYSSVNYLYLQDDAILDGNTSYFKLVEGDGGINQFYFSIAKVAGKRFSAGLTASWLFGSLQRTTQYISPSIALNISRKETDFYTGAAFQGGLQYYSLPGKKWKHQVGLTSSISTGLRGELSTIYTEYVDTIKNDRETGRNFKLPVSVGIGYSAVKNDRLTVSVEANYYHWPYQKVNYSRSYSNPSMRISGGFEYAFIKKQGINAVEKGYVGFGLNAENNYLRIKDNPLWDISFSVGGGKNLSRNISVYTGMELGSKGDKKLGQIKERYTQFIIGLTLKEIWVGPRYSRRYD